MMNQLVNNMLNFIREYPGISAAVSVVVAGIWPFIKFREYLKDKRFNTYHLLIKELVDEQEHPDRHIKLDRQIAIVYELRKFPSYFPVSIRILNGLKKQWANGDGRIITEINLALEYMSSNWLIRHWKK